MPGAIIAGALESSAGFHPAPVQSDGLGGKYRVKMRGKQRARDEIASSSFSARSHRRPRIHPTALPQSSMPTSSSPSAVNCAATQFAAGASSPNGGAGNGRHLAMPLPQLRFLQMKPLESAMHARLPSQLADGLKGRDGDRFRHVVFKCGIRGALQECMLSLSKFRSRNPSPILVNPFSTEPLSGTGRWPPPSDRQARDCDPPVSQLSPPLPDDPARPPQTFPPGCAPCDAEIHCRKLYR